MQTDLARVILKRGRANPLWHGHPWVYGGAVDRIEGDPSPGALVEVRDADLRMIGRGMLNQRSQIVVRMLTRKEEPLDAVHPREDGQRAIAACLAARIRSASRLRAAIGLPSSETTAYRLVNAEGDGLPGLVIDMYGDVAAVQFTALFMKQNQELVFDALMSLPTPVRPASIVEVAAGGFANVEGFSSGTRAWRGPLAGDEHPIAPVSCREAGIELDVDLLHGQKTGMFLDQRQNRVLLGGLCQGKELLDVYSFAGGFSLQALKHGARRATCVDSSARALERAQHHAGKNRLSGLTVIEADAFRFLETQTPHAYDVVVLDPPKFARSHKDLPSATKGYKRLNALAMNALRPGGLLATCSCSQLLSGELFERVVASAAQEAGRRVTLLLSSSQGPDHPVPPAFPEGRYLTFLLLGVY